MTKKSQLYLLIVVVVGIMANFLCLFLVATPVFADETEDKLYCEVSIDDLFDETSVILIMNNGQSFDSKLENSIKKAGVKISSVEDLSPNIECVANASEYQQTLRMNLETSSKEEVISTIKIIEKFPQIYYVGPNRIVELDQSANDEYFNEQWALDKINIQSAWNITTGSSDVRVGIIDTGIGNHEDLNSNVVLGYDFYNNSNDTQDDVNGHGTEVAGIIGGVSNNSKGIAGINWNVSLVPLQVCEDKFYRIDSAACVKAVNYATDSYNTSEPIKILNYSIGGYEPRPELEVAIRNYPGLFVCSTGNSGGDNDSVYHYPSFYGSSLHSAPLKNIIAVGRSDRNDEIPLRSNVGKKTVSLFAPGEDIRTTATPYMFFRHGEYVENSGSSFSAPHVAGVAALLLAKYPEMSTAQIKETILSNVDRDSKFSELCVSGGRLNAYKALSNPHLNHNYTSEYQSIDSEQHKAICKCGEYTTAAHNYYRYVEGGYHNMTCSCGHIGESHLFKSKRIDGQRHSISCDCGQYTEAHIVLGGWSSTKINKCMICRGIVETGWITIEGTVETLLVTDNGSYIMPNGVIVLMYEDCEAYFNGTLEFKVKHNQRFDEII